MSFESSPSESQCRRIPESRSARCVISVSVSSLMAATTTSSPFARAASSTKKGKRPLPAIRPSGLEAIENYLTTENRYDSVRESEHEGHKGNRKDTKKRMSRSLRDLLGHLRGLRVRSSFPGLAKLLRVYARRADISRA